MKRFIYLLNIVCGLLASVFFSCEDDKEQMPRLFRPSFIETYCLAEANTITLYWRTSAEATSYTVEASTDLNFRKDVQSLTVTEGRCTFDNLLYETIYHVRVRANNEALGITSNWTDYKEPILTLTRIIPKILYRVDEKDISENSVKVKWKPAEEYPVTGLTVWQEGEWGTVVDEQHFELSESMVAAGEYEITGLSPRTSYYVALVDDNAVEGAEKYNTQQFKTGGMPSDAVVVEDGLDLLNKIKEGMEDETKDQLIFQLKNGTDYYLTNTGQLGGTTGGVTLKKSIALLANPGERPTLYLYKGGFQISANATNIPEVEYFVVENVNIKEAIPAGGTSGADATRLLFIGKHNAGTDFVIDRFEVRNSDIALPASLLMMSQASDGLTTINKIRVENCLVTGNNDVAKQYGFIHAPYRGSNIWSDVAVTNCTFYDFYVSQGVFGKMDAGGLLSANSKISVSNCSFYKWSTSNASSSTAIGNFSKISAPFNMEIKSCVFGKSEGKILLPGSSCVLTQGDNYCTDDFEQASNSGIGLIALGMDDATFFKNAESFDFTVLDIESSVYKYEHGDPRWITVLDYVASND